jgi:enoyl-CoA hydratase/carnithine racemase
MPDLTSLSKQGHIAILRLERPEAMNAISGAMADEIVTRARYVSEDGDVWAVIIAAAGDKAFCVGADLKERGSFSLEDFYENRKQIRGMFEALRAIPQPTIAAVFGYALGGGFELALSCDLIVAAEGTQLGLPEARVGLLPAGGGTQLLTRKLGPSRAKDLIFRGARFDASEALAWGLVARVVRQEDLPTVAGEVALEICRSSPVAVRAAKSSIDAALGVPIEEGIEIEHQAWETVISSDDRLEGIAAFNEKRDPAWKNR